MKNLRIMTFVSAFVLVAAFSAQAQAPYKGSIGVTVGNFEGISFKTFPSDHFALQLDLGYKVTKTTYSKRYRDYRVRTNMMAPTLELNMNLMGERNITKGLYWFLGGGVSLGYNWYTVYRSNYYDYDYYDIDYYSDSHQGGKFGANVIGGLEYKFNFPLTLQFDFRPGYGLLFWQYQYDRRHTTYLTHYFDWAVCASARYTF